MNIETTLLTLVIGIGLFFYGWYQKQRGYWLSLSGSLILMILGIMLFNSPILFNNGATIETVGVQDVITYTYSAQDVTLNLILAWVFTLVGLFGIMISSNRLYQMRFEGYEEQTEI